MSLTDFASKYMSSHQEVFENYEHAASFCSKRPRPLWYTCNAERTLASYRLDRCHGRSLIQPLLVSFWQSTETSKNVGRSSIHCSLSGLQRYLIYDTWKFKSSASAPDVKLPARSLNSRHLLYLILLCTVPAQEVLEICYFQSSRIVIEQFVRPFFSPKLKKHVETVEVTNYARKLTFSCHSFCAHLSHGRPFFDMSFAWEPEGFGREPLFSWAGEDMCRQLQTNILNPSRPFSMLIVVDLACAAYWIWSTGSWNCPQWREQSPLPAASWRCMEKGSLAVPGRLWWRPHLEMRRPPSRFRSGRLC